MKISMKKRIASIVLVAAIMFTLVPYSVVLADENVNLKQVNAESVDMPAQQFKQSTSNGIDVEVRADKNIFPKGTKMSVSEVSSEKANAIADKSMGRQMREAVGVDISFRDFSGREIEPKDAQKVSVSISLKNKLKGKKFNVLHEKDSGSVEVMPADVSASKAEFKSGSFSIYVITGDEKPNIKTYNFYDDKGQIFDTQVVKSGDVLNFPKTPSKKGYKFVGWTSEKNGNESNFNEFGKQVVNKTESISLYPVFKEARYVFFMDRADENGRVIETREVAKGEKIEVSDVRVPLESTKKVASWHKDKSLSGESKVNELIMGDENITLYPNIKSGYYLNLIAGEGATYIPPKFVFGDEKNITLEEPKKAGYTFNGWYFDKEGKEKYDFKKISENKKDIYALWTPSNKTKYTVVFWKQSVKDDKNLPDDKKTYDFAYSEEREATTDSEVSLTEEDKVKAYTGFHYSKSKSVKIKGDGSSILNVYYDRNLMKLTFYKKVYRFWFIPFWSAKEYMTGLYGQTLEENNEKWPAKEYWQEMKSDGGLGKNVVFLNSFIFDNLGAKSEKYPNDTLNLYTEKDISGNLHIKHYKQNLNNTYDDAKDDFTSAGDEFFFTNKYNGFTVKKYRMDENGKFNEIYPGDSVKLSKGNENTKLFVYHERNKYPLAFYNYNGYEMQDTKDVLYEKSLKEYDYSPKKPQNLPNDFKFAGWFKDKSLTEKFDFAKETMPSEGLTLYAKWEAPKYKVRVHLDINGKGEVVEREISRGDAVDEISMPTVKNHDGSIVQRGIDEKSITLPKGYDWIGWTEKVDGKIIKYNFDKKIYGKAELYPNYISRSKYKVSYDANGGKGNFIDSKAYAEGTYGDIQNADKIVSPENKVFLCWNTEKNGKGTDYYPRDKIKVEKDIVLYGKYGDVQKNVKLIYKSNYPENLDKNIEKTQVINGKTDLTNNSKFNIYSIDEAGFNNDKITKKYYFAGWQDNRGNILKSGVKVLVDNMDENILKAKWVKKDELKIIVTGTNATRKFNGQKQSVGGYKVSYKLNGASVQRIDGIDLKIVDFRAEGVNVGTYYQRFDKTKFEISGPSAYKYNISIDTIPGMLKIEKDGKLDVLVRNYNGKYDGKLHTATVVPKVTKDTKVSYKVEGTDKWVEREPEIKDAGSVNFEVKVENPNYETNVKRGKITVKKRVVELKSQGEVFTHDGKVHKNMNVTEGGDKFVYGEVSDLKATGMITDIGEVVNSITYKREMNYKDKNYEVHKNEGKLKVVAHADKKSKNNLQRGNKMNPKTGDQRNTIVYALVGICLAIISIIFIMYTKRKNK